MCNDQINKKQDLDESKCCGARIVKVHKPWHVCMFMMNFSSPGAGTFWNACCCHDDKVGCVCGNLFYAWIMQVTAVCIVGWIQSMAFGVGIYKKAK